MQKTYRFQYSQHFIDDGYREILLPANRDGTYKLDKKAIAYLAQREIYAHSFT